MLNIVCVRRCRFAKFVAFKIQTLTANHAGGPCRAVFEMLGLQDVVAKSTGSQNPYNMIRATFEGLKDEYSPRQVASRRGKKVSDILPSRDEPKAEAVEAEAPAEAPAEA